MGSAAWAGAMFLLASPLAMAASVGGVCAMASRARLEVTLGAALFGATIVHWLPAATIEVAAVAVVVVGLVAALRLRLGPISASLVAAVAGLGAGSAGQFYWATPAELAGGLAAICLVMTLGWFVVRFVLRHVQSVDRVRLGLAILGAWIATLGALMLLLRWS